MPELDVTVVHVIPESVFSNTYHGSYKDTISRVRFLQERVEDYRQIRVPEDEPAAVMRELVEIRSPRFLIEYSLLPRITAAIRERHPDAFIAVRSHNIEPFQHLDNHGWWSKRGPLWNAYACSRLFRHDLVAKRNASEIWSISDWETAAYWDRLPGRAECRWLPYHCPAHLVNDDPTEHSQRTRIVCLPTASKNRKSWDLVTRFIRLAEHLKQNGRSRYEFVITGDLQDWGLPASDSVSYTGMIDDLCGFMNSVNSVALLSPLGFGFKTTIGDAIANNASVLIHPKLARRCPPMIKNAFVSIDTEMLGDPAVIFDQIDRVEGHAKLDRQLRAMNNDVLQGLLPGSPRSVMTQGVIATNERT
ncbi:hypothetical protein [Stieleria mannarensis]|uniref:hypothetical protein n=1 Tax=Stieleria mannarensis TaxID=2755585 RepID=UPI0015FFC539|nr:hypothetical protein [Rhodopirellula sp. JC639]